MKLTKKTLLKTTIISFSASIVVSAAMLASLMGAYSCVDNDTACKELDTATTTIHIGVPALYICWSVFIISLGLCVYYLLKKKP